MKYYQWKSNTKDYWNKRTPQRFLPLLGSEVVTPCQTTENVKQNIRTTDHWHKCHPTWTSRYIQNTCEFCGQLSKKDGHLTALINRLPEKRQAQSIIPYLTSLQLLHRCHRLKFHGSTPFHIFLEFMPFSYLAKQVFHSTLPILFKPRASLESLVKPSFAGDTRCGLSNQTRLWSSRRQLKAPSSPQSVGLDSVASTW
jgi:hypothetical protein